MNKAKLLMPVLALVTTCVALAHVTVSPKESGAGATQKYTLRVPNEKAVPNVRVEAEFPAAAEVVSVEDVTGWKLDLTKDGSGRITGAVWTGNLEAKGIAELSFFAKNPKEGTKLVWKVVQVYQDGSKSQWTGEQGTKNPAPTTTINP